MKTMAASFRSLVEDYPRYLEAFKLFRERSTEDQCMQDFIHNTLPDILASIGGGRPNLSVMGVGSGAGEIDLEMLAQLHLKQPHVKVNNEVVEPSNDMLLKYKDRISNTPDLDHIHFAWNNMTASEFQKHWQEKNPGKKMDFIHMIHMLYYVNNPEATVSFFRSLLNKDGKLMIILVSGESGWGNLRTTFKENVCNTEISQCVTTGDIKTFLDSEGIPYRNYELLSQLDITECFTEGDPVGELLLDFLTAVIEFSKNASEDLKKRLLDLLRNPDYSKEENGRIIFSNNLGALVVEP